MADGVDESHNSIMAVRCGICSMLHATQIVRLV
jgi:hypothetical protein